MEDGRYSKKGESMRAKVQVGGLNHAHPLLQAALYEFIASKGKSVKESDIGIAAFDQSTNPNLAALSRKPDAALVQVSSPSHLLFLHWRLSHLEIPRDTFPVLCCTENIFCVVVKNTISLLDKDLN